MGADTPERLADWLRRAIEPSRPLTIYYHGDADGCVSAAYWVEIARALGAAPSTRKVSTAELNLNSATTDLERKPTQLAIFLDIAAGSKFTDWQPLTAKGLRVFVYDHHEMEGPIPEVPPDLIQYDPATGKFPPTCVFSHDFHTYMTSRQPGWLVTIGLCGEGRYRYYQEYLDEWPHRKDVVPLIVHGVLRPDDAALEYLLYYLRSGDPPPAPAHDPRAQGLLKTSFVIDAAVQRATTAVLEGARGAFVAKVIQTDYPIANYVASNVKNRLPGALVVVGQPIAGGLLGVELRTGRDCHHTEGLSILKNLEQNASQPVEGYLSRSPTKNLLHYHRSPRYWIRGMNFEQYFKSPARERSIHHFRDLYFRIGEAAEVVGAVLNSSLFFFWFLALSNARNLTGNDVAFFPIGPIPDAETTGLASAFTRLMADYKANSFVRVRSDCEFQEFRPSLSKPIIDEIDRLLARHCGFSDEEADFVINYDIKYRMGGAEEEDE